MRFSRSRRRRGPLLALNLATMLDATFLLLAYFLVSAAAQRLEMGLESALVVGGDLRSDLEPAVLVVQREGAAAVFRLGERTLRDRAGLEAALAQLDRSATLRLQVHPGPSVEAVAAALQAVQDAGFEEVAYEAMPQR
jgi:biopolymer transport protein ExbD